MTEPPVLDAEALAIYRAILLHHEHDPGRLAGRLGSTAERVRSAIERLTALGMLRPSWERPDLVRAVSPEVGLEMMLQREQHELALRQERLAQTRATLRLLATEYAAHTDDGGSGGGEVLRGLDAIRTRLEALANQCTDEVLSFLPGGSLPTEAIRAGRPLNEQAMRRGVKFRSVYLQSVTKDRITHAYVREIRTYGSEVRLAPTLPMRLLVVDGGTAVLPCDTDTGERSALVVRSAPLITALTALFEAYWKDAEPLDGPEVAPPLDAPAPQERELLRMLARGDKDEAVARALGVSVRTERRMVADLLARTGASSRLELGVRAAKLGWV
ncbi:helix-turn-helix transcriptional regulator [Streptomyces sp. NPDC003077]|uniref:helix-turn-helix transcriptional regulator n=1 Tax=Streptomyces sp. NPDC003077 TaxID=3154443 RepID=UPI0033B9F357